MRLKCLFVILFLFISVAFTYATDSTMLKYLLAKIQQFQIKEPGVFPKGAFPSYRMYALNKDREKADINPFFTGLIAMTLQEIQADLPKHLTESIHQIRATAIPVFTKFQNRKGRPTYNFWPTDTPKIFPNAGWLNLFDKPQSLPDDLDDTVILLLASNASASTAKEVHQLMQAFTNHSGKAIKNTHPAYSNLGAYSTWFGKKMPVDFDICVLSNVLYFVEKNRLTWTKADSASLSYLIEVIKRKDHLEHPSQVSPHYGKTSIIYYHLSRLMALQAIPALSLYQSQLIEEAKKALKETNDFMEKIILSTSLLKWGVPISDPIYFHSSNWEDLIESNDFSFFIANMASMLPHPFKQWMGGLGLGKFDYHCEAYNYTLVLEYLSLLNKSKQHGH